MPYKRKDGNLKKPWVGQIVVNGKARRATFATKQAAKKWESEQEKACLLLIPTISLGELAIRYLDFAQSKFVRKTYLEKVAVFRRLFKVLDRSLPVGQLFLGVALSFLQVQNDSRSGYAANKDRKNLVASWAWGLRYLDGFPPAPNPFMVEKFSESRKARYVPSEADFWSAYHACRNDQDKALLLTFLHTGARRGEIFRLLWSDIDFHNRTIRLLTRKNRLGTWEESRLPMTDDLNHALSVMLPTSSADNFVFSREGGIQYSCRVHFLKRVCHRAGVKAFGFHAIRHLTASILASSGVPMVQIQAILRHKNLATTERYIRGLESVRESLSFLPGVLDKKPPQEPPETTKAVSLIS